jgi:NAD(P)-dependent dehydrogenase (short-subunit alcohol dehydrogenase family)
MKKNILITGANGFLGSYFTEYFIKNNFVIAVDKKFFNLKKLNKNKNLLLLRCDLSKENSLKNLIRILKKKKIHIDVLINNAAINAIPNKICLLEFKQKKWNEELNVSLFASTFLSYELGNLMKNKSKGCIINIGSDLSIIAPNQKIYKSSFKNYLKPPSYSIIKHGMVGLTKYFASLFARNSIKVNMISPGPIYNNNPENLVRELKKVIPMNRIGRKEDIISSLKFLIDEKNTYITGQNIIIDGGKTII